MGILSLIHLLFQLFILLSLRTWNGILHTFRRIRIRARTPLQKSQHKAALPRYSTTITPAFVPLVQVPAPVVAIHRSSTMQEALGGQTNSQSMEPSLNNVPEGTQTLIHLPSLAEPVTDSVIIRSQNTAKNYWSWTRIFLNFQGANPSQSTIHRDIESAQLHLYRVDPIPSFYSVNGRPPLPQSPPPTKSNSKPSLLSKATELLTKPVPFSSTFPSCLDGQITNRSVHAKECGGYSDIYEATLDGRAVAVKVIRSFTSSSRKQLARSKLQKRVWREYLTWSSLCHPNVLPCLGYTFDFAYEAPHQLPALVSSWMPNGTVLEYLHNHPLTKRIPLLLGITNGLHYLHARSKPVIHGDIRCSNILISATGQPCLTDFGLSRILNDTLGLTTSSDVAGSLRWMSPEILDGEKVTTGSDVWAYGMTILELLTENRPYAYLSAEPAVLRRIIEGTLPLRPMPELAPDLTDDLWLLCLNCWKIEAKNRCTMAQAAQILQQVETVT